MATVHVLLVYSHAEGRLLDQERFRDAKRATAAYEETEAKHSGDDNLEIVLVASDSIETIMKTHGHYFRLSDSSLFSDLLTTPSAT